MIMKTIVAHVLNKVITFIPSILLLSAIALVVSPNYFIFGKDDSGWNILYLFRYMIFLPAVFLDLMMLPLEFIGIIKLILPTLMCLVFIEIISIYSMKGDIGMKIMGLRIVSIKDKPLSLIQIISRTVIKYFSLAFFHFY